MNSRIVIILAILFNGFHKVDAKLNVIPRDAEVKINDSTYLNCSTSLQADSVHWRHGNNYVYTGIAILEPYNDRFSVEINTSTGASNLVIRSVQPSDAGQYECLEDEGVGEGRSAQLIVLDDDPVCKSNIRADGVIGPNSCGIEPDEVQLSCNITYHGIIPPILKWKVRGSNQSNTEGLLFINLNKNEVIYTLTMNSTLDLNNASFICQTTRTSDRQYSCSSDIIKIMYIFSSKLTTNTTMNDEVFCSANTSQTCSYKWKWFSGDDSTTESDNQILKPRKVGRHRCEATCSIGNRSCTVQAVYAEVYSITTSSKQNLLTLLVLLLIPAIIAVAVIGAIVHYRRKKKEKDIGEPKRSEEEIELKEEQGQTDELSEKYKSDPVLVQTIRTKASEEKKKWIKGLTILDKELFVLSQMNSEVEVYDLMKFSVSRRWNLKELIFPVDIVSCNRNKCLYINDYKSQDQSCVILRLVPNGKLIKKWPTGDDCGDGLSVTYESNIILTVFNKNKLNEYSLDGQLIREINLSSEEGIRHTMHAIKLTNGHFVVSHGYYDDDMHRVCIVDEGGRLKKSFGGKREVATGQMNKPFYLAVDRNGFVMVADRENSRVLLLDSNLEFKREILSRERHEIRNPMRILLDESNDRLFVACNELINERIMIFDFSQL